jgi:UTP:GlnB (protein PII) uridylyltransferase
VVFRNYPGLLLELIQVISEKNRKLLLQRLSVDLWDPQSAAHRDRLITLIKLQYLTSRYVRRVLEKVILVHPQVLEIINQPKALADFGRGIGSQVDPILNFKERRKKLAEYHDFQFLRVCLLALTRAPNHQVADEYIEFSDLYLQQLFDACKREVDSRHSGPVPEKSLISILATGGYGHRLAFDDDYDLIILVDSEQASVKRYYEAILTKMNTEIARSGILPHYRLAEYTGSYACTVCELDSLLQNHQMDAFIDQSQLLGARMVVGSQFLQTGFFDGIIRSHIFSQKKRYGLAMLAEIHQRHLVHDRATMKTISLKESPGGLRDIEMVLDIFRALYEVNEHSNYRIFGVFQTILPDYRRQFQVLMNQYDFLRTIRNLHRLAVAADDVLNPDYMNLLVEILSDSDGFADAKELMDRILAGMAIVREIQNEFVEEILLPALQ